MKSFVRIKILIMAVSVLYAGISRADGVDDLIQLHMKKEKIPGISVAVVRGGKIIKEQGYGLADIENNVPVTPETVFQSGSTGKQFTAALVMLLVADGKIALDHPISQYLPNTPAAWEKITVRHLLTHTSGLADPYSKLNSRKDYSDEELIQIEGEIPLLSAPGEKWSYSNMGYHILGFLCNNVGGKFYGEQLQERIFKPTGMQARIINERDIVLHRASGYDLVNGEFKNQEWVSPVLNTTADGSLYLTAHDFALWDLALYSDKPLSQGIKDVIWTPVRLNDGSTYAYGFGWRLNSSNGHRTIEHAGGWQGFSAFVSRFVDDKLTVIVLANRSGPGVVGSLTHRIAEYYLPDLADPVGRSKDKQ